MARHMSPDMPTVLLVDSAHDDRTMYAEYLRACGWNPLEVENTADALTAAMAADVVVTGIRVHGPFDGVELVRRLRDSSGTHDKPIIVLTACAFEPDQQRALAAGCHVPREAVSPGPNGQRNSRSPDPSNESHQYAPDERRHRHPRLVSR